MDVKIRGETGLHVAARAENEKTANRSQKLQVKHKNSEVLVSWFPRKCLNGMPGTYLAHKDHDDESVEETKRIYLYVCHRRCVPALQTLAETT